MLELRAGNNSNTHTMEKGRIFKNMSLYIL